MINSQSFKREDKTMADNEGPVELHEYEVEVNGKRTRLQLTEKDAEDRGFTDAKVDAKAASKAPANKARGAQNKGA